MAGSWLWTASVPATGADQVHHAITARITLSEGGVIAGILSLARFIAHVGQIAWPWCYWYRHGHSPTAREWSPFTKSHRSGMCELIH